MSSSLRMPNDFLGSKEEWDSLPASVQREHSPDAAQSGLAGVTTKDKRGSAADETYPASIRAETLQGSKTPLKRCVNHCGNRTANRIGEVPVCKECEDTKVAEKLRSMIPDESRQDYSNFHLQRGDWTIPGMGEKGSIWETEDGEKVPCMTEVVVSLCKNFDGYKTINANCDNIECPNCWQRWLRKAVFRYSVKLEAYARHKDERPCHVQFSLHPDDCDRMKWGEIKRDLIKKGYREMKRKMGAYAGLRVLHPFRIPEAKKRILEAEGWKRYRCIKCGSRVVRTIESKHPFECSNCGHKHDPDELTSGDRLWSFLRSFLDKTDEFSLYDFVSLEYHCHSITFPGHLEGYDGSRDFVINRVKNSYLNRVSDVVDLTRYVLTHCAITQWKKRNTPAQFWGKLYHWDPESHLEEEDLLQVKEAVAKCMNAEYDRENEKLILYEKKEFNCPECGAHSSSFVGGQDFVTFSQENLMSMYYSIKHNFSESRAKYFKYIFDYFIDSIKNGKNYLVLSHFKKDFDSLGMACIHVGYDPPKGCVLQLTPNGEYGENSIKVSKATEFHPAVMKINAKKKIWAKVGESDPNLEEEDDGQGDDVYEVAASTKIEI